MQARLALRLMPRMTYGLGYSKGIRFAQHSGKNLVTVFNSHVLRKAHWCNLQTIV